jgi:hypothetical protein
MWQPNRGQWRLIWAVALLAILAWPVQNGSLAVKAVHWAVDPFQTLPPTPRPLTLGRGDDMDAVQEHDADEAAYYTLYKSSRIMRWRLELRDLDEPIDPPTERQVLIGLAIILGLVIWRKEAGRV